MTMEELRDELLKPEGMAFFRRTMLDHYVWFMHESSIDNVGSMRSDSIKLGLPCGVPDYVNAALSKVAGIACVNPLCGRYVGGSSGSRRQFRMAVRGSDLPMRLGLDWSYPESRDMRDITEQQITAFGKDGAILYVVHDTGSIASYDPIPPSGLRVCTRGKHGQFPSTWPLLSNVQDAGVMAY